MEYKDMERMYSPEQLHVGNTWWYIIAEPPVGSTKGGVLLGPYNSQAEAEKTAVEGINGSYEVIPLNTRDRNRAGHIIRHRRFASGTPLPQVLRRMKHTI